MKIVLVDGFKIRQTLDTEFALMHVFSDDPRFYYPNFYIPKGERWMDYRFRDELEYLIKAERALRGFYGEAYLKKRREMVKGNGLGQGRKSYEVAHEYAVAVEKEKRRKNGAVYPGDVDYPSGRSASELIESFRIKPY